MIFLATQEAATMAVAVMGLVILCGYVAWSWR